MGNPLESQHSFFKLMIGPFKTKLRIPPNFKNHLLNIGDKSVLKGPLGDLSDVEIQRIGDDLYFQSGWEAFVSDHSIDAGDVVIFRHAGGDRFDVTIFGKNGCAKTSAPPPPIAGKQNPESEILPETPSEPSSVPAAAAWGTLVMGRTSEGCIILKSMRRDANGNKALQAALSFTPLNPYFIDIAKRTKMIIPKSLAREYELVQKGSVILQNQAGSTWHVKISCCADGRVMLGAGWSNFRRENHLGEGDICVFEFLRKDNAIHVHIFRDKELCEEMVAKIGVEDTSQIVSKPDKSYMAERDLEAITSFKTCHSKVVFLWSTSYRYHLNIPRTVVREHNLMGRSIVLQDSCGRLWPVKTNKSKDGRVSMGSGMSKFLKENQLRVGDACAFEFIHGSNRVQVRINSPGDLKLFGRSNRVQVCINWPGLAPRRRSPRSTLRSH